MLPKSNRLNKEKDFKNLFNRGKKYSLSSFKVYIKIGSNNLKQSRFGFIVSKKISKKSVVRNKIKRRLREAIKDSLPEIKKGVDVAIIILPGFEENNFQSIKETLYALFKKAKLINLP